MKKTILFTLLVVVGLSQATALEYEYVPFVREGVKWVYYYKNEDGIRPADPMLSYGKVYLNLEIKGDTVINGKTYKAMHKYHGDAINSENDTIPIFLREDDKVVYGLVPDGIKYPDCPIGNPYEEFLFEQIDNGEEFILYDFNDPINYWSSRIPKYNGEETSGYNYLYTDTIALGHHLAKRYVATRDYLGEFSMIEGIGVDARGPGYTLFPFRPMAIGVDTFFGFSHVIEDGEIIYKGVNYTEPEPDDYEYVPFVREGVKWVYSIDNPCSEEYSDMYLPIPSGISYYSYEMKGDAVFDGKHYKPVILYYIDSVGIEIVQDIVPVYLREENKVVYAYHPDGRTYLQCPVGYGGSADVVFGWASFFYPMDFFNDGEFILYDFNRPDTFYDNLVDILLQVGDDYMSYLRTDIVKIGKYNCKRHFYKGYDDDSPTNVIIEGIGCDGIGCMPLCYFPIFTTSFEIGYWLSHVIEDGEIIYKGMGYSDDALVGIDEVVADRTRRPADPNYYNLTGQPVGKDVPTTPGIYIHQGKKVVVR